MEKYKNTCYGVKQLDGFVNWTEWLLMVLLAGSW